MDYRTGEVLAYVGSARYAGKGNRKYQPQFDVLARGWRQPGSSIKPIDYAIGIDDETYTASTMFMDVVTDFGRGFTPTQADKKERGPVRLRSALQFSLNIPAIKATLVQGLEHTFDRSRDFGLVFPPTAIPVTSMGIGTLETHPIDMLTAYGAIANGGVKMPRQLITKVVNENGVQVWPPDEAKPEGTAVISPQAAYIITDVMAGNTVPSINKYWGKWAITTKNGRRRPAAYKTGTTSDNRDVHAYGYLAPPRKQQCTEQRQLVARLIRTALVGDPQRGECQAAGRLVQGARRSGDGLGRRVHGSATGPVHEEDRQGAVHQGHRPARARDAPGVARRRRGFGPALARRLRRSQDHARLLQPQ
jgi:hypothetical protein